MKHIYSCGPTILINAPDNWQIEQQSWSRHFIKIIIHKEPLLHESRAEIKSDAHTWDLLQALFGCLAVHKLSLGGAEAGVGWGHHGAVIFRECPGAKKNKGWLLTQTQESGKLCFVHTAEVGFSSVDNKNSTTRCSEFSFLNNKQWER